MIRDTSILGETFKRKLRKYTNFHFQGKDPNIFIFSTARSGSTWLMELISTQKGIKYINEPLHPPKLNRMRIPIPTDWRLILPNPERENILKYYFNELIENNISLGTSSLWSRFHKWITWRIAFKILKCKDLMNWFEEQFGGQIVYLIRHPISTNLSRKMYDLLPLYLTNKEFCDKFLNKKQIQLAHKILENGSDLDKKVLDWCLQNLAPMKYLDRSGWLCIHYEDLVIEPDATIDRLCGKLKLNQKELIRKQYLIASRSTHISDSKTQAFLKNINERHSRNYLINKWRKKLTVEDEIRAFDIIRQFDIDCYDAGSDFPVNRL